MVHQPKEELQSVYGLRLMRAFFRIKDQKQRHAVIEIAEQFAGNDLPKDEQQRLRDGPDNWA